MKKLMLAAAALVLLSSPALATDAAAPAVETKTVTLKDGTKVGSTSDDVAAVEADVEMPNLYQIMDTNADGYLSKEEISNKRFNDIDSNKDGKILREELMRQVSQRELIESGISFDVIDSNTDSSISKAEFTAGFLGNVFDQIDLNKDGKLSGLETCASIHGVDTCLKFYKNSESRTQD